MKICLIELRPPGVNVYDMTLLPRLGLPLIGGLLHQRGHDVVIYCEMLAPVDWGEVAEGADVVGFSCTTSTAPAAYVMAARARLAGIPTVIGGPHVTFLPDEALDHCDYVVRGEGQVTMLELVEALAEGRDRQGPSVPASRPREERLRAILGLSYQDSQGRKVHNPPRSPCSQEEFAALPPPDLSLIVGHERMDVMPIMTQWGCPFDCDFCSVIQMFGRKVRYRHVADVLDELEQRRPAYVFFYDDNFVVDRKRTVALLQGVIERGLSFKWTAQMRADTVYKDRRTGELDHGLLRLMRDSGCFMVFCGFESANPATLVAYNKRQSIQTITDSIRAFHAYGIYVHGMFVLGSDEDDVTNIRYTVDFALRNKIDTVQFLILTPCPGTPFYERMEHEGRILSHAWELYDGHHTVMQPGRISPYTLQMETYRAMARFYSNWQIARLAISQMIRSAPYLLWLALREYKLGLQLPWLTLLSLIPQQRERALRILQGTLSRRSWEALQRRFTVAALRKYGHDQIRKWARQAHSLDYLEKIRAMCAYTENKTLPREIESSH